MSELEYITETAHTVAERLTEADGEEFTASVNTRKEINDGLCDVFAERLAERLRGLEDVEVVRCGFDHTLHVWVVCQGVHFDAEAPEGVLEWCELPFWKRVDLPAEKEYVTVDRETHTNTKN